MNKREGSSFELEFVLVVFDSTRAVLLDVFGIEDQILEEVFLELRELAVLVCTARHPNLNTVEDHSHSIREGVLLAGKLLILHQLKAD